MPGPHRIPKRAQHPLGVIARKPVGFRDGDRGHSPTTPARSSAPFTWALEAGSWKEEGRRFPPLMVSGRPSVRPAPRVPRPAPKSTEAPMATRRSVTRRIGRRRREASPVKVAENRRPAMRPRPRRVVVPELPQSNGPLGRRHGPLSLSTPPCAPRPAPRATTVPSFRSTRAVDRASDSRVLHISCSPPGQGGQVEGTVGQALVSGYRVSSRNSHV
jgi:hypothetical protein